MPGQLTTLDIILDAYKFDKTESLSPIQKIELQRWSYADDILRQYHDSKTVIALIQAKFSISQAQAYRDIQNAKRFFGTVNISDKPFYRNLYAESLEELAKLARSKNDYKSAIMALKEAAEIRGLKDGDSVDEIYRDIEPCKFVMEVTIVIDGQKKLTEINLDRWDNTDVAAFEVISSELQTAPSLSEAQMIKLLNRKNGESTAQETNPA